MKRLGITTVSLAVAAAAVLVGSAVAGTSVTRVKLTGTYAGAANVKVTDDVADISANGSGTNTVMKAGKITGLGKGDASAQPCVPFNGTGTITGAKGTKLNFTMLSGASGCGDEQGQVFSISGRAKITGGAGKVKVGTKLYSLAKAKGTIKLTGVYNRGGASFTVKVNGTLTL